jgi:hypothetical protein
VNLHRLHPVAFPDVSAHAPAFDSLIAATPPGEAVSYTPDAPRWWFLHHLVRRGFVLHGSNSTTIDEFEPRGNFDAHNVRHVEGVFASDDAIWPIYFATADRTGGRRGLINWCEHTGAGARYLFALEGEPSWSTGWSTRCRARHSSRPRRPASSSAWLRSVHACELRSRRRTSHSATGRSASAAASRYAGSRSGTPSGSASSRAPRRCARSGSRLRAA